MSDMLPPKQLRKDGPLRRLFGCARTVVGNVRKRRAMRQAFDECGRAGVLDATLADLGVTKGDIGPLIKGYPGSEDLLAAMCRRMGIDAMRLQDPTTARVMQRSCALCANHGRCARWLKVDPFDDYHDFCPNAELIDFLRKRAAAAR